MSKRAVVVVDLQNEYLRTGKLPLVGIDQALNNAARIISAARNKGDLVVHVRHESAPGAAFFVPGTDGVEIHPSVAPQEGEQVIVKHAPNSFLNTTLKQLLDEQNVEEVTIVGAMSHMCVDATTRAASDFGYKTTVVDDACATRELEFRGETVPAAQVHAAMMAALEFAYAKVTTTEEYISG
ncbi:cysteine hydrolase [Massilia violaceinigra]|uniref:Cysteine hydrolase n=1 Tax=Massilia violaceinigra TaxID=2045208 RepID=A0A2D2DQ23_9BURK|nr:cysteine hydrolase family protein [Massilia violaceinigra]ATQ77071.1 cysteine hydrolase [Massilia violaceinigra]